jgi:hypothetical protein
MQKNEVQKRKKKTSLKTKRRNKTVIWERRKHDCSIFTYKQWALTYCKRTQVNQSTLTPNLLYSISPTDKENTKPSEHLYFHCNGSKCDFL